MLLGYFLIVALARCWSAGVRRAGPAGRAPGDGRHADRHRQHLAELASDDMLAGRISTGRFARRVEAVRARQVGADVWGFPWTAAVSASPSPTRAASSCSIPKARTSAATIRAGTTCTGPCAASNGARSTRDDPADADSTVMHVAAPIYDDAHRIVGVLTVAKPNRAMAPFIAQPEHHRALGFRADGRGAAGRPVRGVVAVAPAGAPRRYADAVAHGERAPQPRAAGEFGDLGRALHDMREKLEGKQYVEQYVHALTHEPKGPLAAIRGAAELFENPMPEADRARFVASIRAQGERMAQMVDKLLALAAVEHRQRLETRERIDLRSLAQEAVAQCTTGDIPVIVNGTASVVEGDPFLLRQAIANLVENAVSFSPAGGRSRSMSRAMQGVASSAWSTAARACPTTPCRTCSSVYSLPRPDGGSRSSGLACRSSPRSRRCTAAAWRCTGAKAAAPSRNCRFLRPDPLSWERRKSRLVFPQRSIAAEAVPTGVHPRFTVAPSPPRRQARASAHHNRRCGHAVCPEIRDRAGADAGDPLCRWR